MLSGEIALKITIIINVDKRVAVQRRAARFVLSFYDYCPTADLGGRNLCNLIHCSTLEVLHMCVFVIN